MAARALANLHRVGIKCPFCTRQLDALVLAQFCELCVHVAAYGRAQCVCTPLPPITVRSNIRPLAEVVVSEEVSTGRARRKYAKIGAA